MLARTLTMCVALAVATNASAQMDSELRPAPDGETAQSVIERVIATERAEAESGPPFIVVREKTGMSPVPALSVYQKVDDVGYMHVPLSSFIQGALSEEVSGEELKYPVLGAMAFGLAVIAELHLPGSGERVATGGEEIIEEMREDDDAARAARAEGWREVAARAQTLRRFIEEATLVGLAQIDGEETWYLAADGLDVRQTADSTDAFGGEMVIDKAEIWVSRRLNRITALRFTGHGAEGAYYLIPIESFEWPEGWGDAPTGLTSVKVPVGGFIIAQTRTRFEAVQGSRVLFPRRTINDVSFQPAQDGPDREVLGTIRALAEYRNYVLQGVNEELQEIREGRGDPRDSVTVRGAWEAFHESYEQAMVGLEAAARMSAEPVEGGSEVHVECAVRAESVEMAYALLATLGRAALDPGRCG